MAFQAMRQHDKPFRFMDLPKDVRLMVYERLTCETHHHDVPHPDGMFISCTTLVVKSVPTSILGVCKEIYDEAHVILSKMIDAFILSSPPRIIEGLSNKREYAILRTIAYLLAKHHARQPGNTDRLSMDILVLLDGNLAASKLLLNSPALPGRIRSDIQDMLSEYRLDTNPLRIRIAKFIAQAAMQFRRQKTGKDLSQVPAIELVKKVGNIADVHLHWLYGMTIRSLNQKIAGLGIAVEFAGALRCVDLMQENEGFEEIVTEEDGNEVEEEEDTSVHAEQVPQQVSGGCVNCGRFPRLNVQMDKETWVDGWLEGRFACHFNFGKAPQQAVMVRIT